LNKETLIYKESNKATLEEDQLCLASLDSTTLIFVVITLVLFYLTAKLYIASLLTSSNLIWRVMERESLWKELVYQRVSRLDLLFLESLALMDNTVSIN
jgi:hypothetical protein